MQISFRPIFEKDVDKLRDIAKSTFRQAYEHLNSPSNFAWYIQRAFNREKLLSEISNEKSYCFFAMLGSDIIGYLKLNIGKSQTEFHTDEYLEIERIYMDAPYKRKGIGKKMIELALEKAHECGKSKVWLGVWDQNPGAILFYERVGFSRNGSHIFKFGDEDQIDIIMEMAIRD